MKVGSYNRLLSYYVKQDLADLIVGAAMIFMGGALLVCLFFMSPSLVSGSLYLVLVILSFGVLLITYSPYLTLIVSGGGRLRETLFDLALFTLLPSILFYFEHVFGPGWRRLTARIRRFQLLFSLICLGLLVLNAALSFRLDALYSFLTVDVIGVLIIGVLLYLLCLSLAYTRRGNPDATLFSIGFSVFALLSVSEMVRYYLSGSVIICTGGSGGWWYLSYP